MKKIIVTDDSKKKAKDELGKMKGKDILKMNQNELVKLLAIVCQKLGVADKDNLIK